MLSFLTHSLQCVQNIWRGCEILWLKLCFVCCAGVAGCMATVLHDATMNPAEGKLSSSISLLMYAQLMCTQSHVMHSDSKDLVLTYLKNLSLLQVIIDHVVFL